MRISILIPCFNEEATVAACVASCLEQSRPADQIVIVNDGSTDSTASILQSFGDRIQVVNTPRNLGNKSYAQEYGLNFVTGDILVTTDADTMLSPTFLERIEKNFQDPAVHAVAGYIQSLKHNWITACRELDYIVGQDVHKKAQSNIGAILVVPGCGAAYRTATFRELITFDHDTITEDLDFTYKFHRNDLKVNFDSEAIVYTQDPPTLLSYVKQMQRWIGGGWQNVLKHKSVILRRPSHAFEISLIYIEGMVFGALFFILPVINVTYFLLFFTGYFSMAAIIGLYGAIRRRRWDLLGYAIFFPIVLLLNSLIFFEQFFKVVVFRKRELSWFKPERRSISI
jgi:cellulose synthase/poly-beta-1,6-N-acetylglucosamine synthase-like glycosyltransferase